MNVLECVKVEVPMTGCKLHSHAQWEIIYNLTGNVVSEIGGREYHIAPGDVMVVPPGMAHNGKPESVYTDMFFRAQNLDFADVVVVQDSDGSIQTLMNLLHKVYTEKEQDYGSIGDNLVQTVCAFIKKLHSDSCKYPFVSRLKNIIYDNISNPAFDLTAEIAATGYNKDYFRRCFRKDLGKSPLEYLTCLRISQAKTLLVQDIFVSVEDVAASCGFDDNFYFSTCFKKHVGVSPLQYRKNTCFRNP